MRIKRLMAREPIDIGLLDVIVYTPACPTRMCR